MSEDTDLPKNRRVMNIGRKQQIKKYISHSIASFTAKHFLYTSIIRRLEFAISSCRKILLKRRIIHTHS